jgi:(1->4)-alpha-D-glucan 1-alpha-D-glucosylmutase
MNLPNDNLQELCRQSGIFHEYYDINGQKHKISLETYSLLKAVLDRSYTNKNNELRILVINAKDKHKTLNFTDRVSGEWKLTNSRGEILKSGEFHDSCLDLNIENLDFNYYYLLIDGERVFKIAVHPDKCFSPLKEDVKFWGPAIQLYAVKSSKNWGIGDFNDLKRLMAFFAANGASFVGINPLHAIFHKAPKDASPYYPSSRDFLNVLYIDIEDTPEFQSSNEAQELIKNDDFQNELTQLRQSALVDYEGVSKVKFKAFDLLFREFQKRELEKMTTRADEFKTFCENAALRKYCIYEAIQEYYQKKDKDIRDYFCWEDYQNGATEDQLPKAVSERIEFYAYLQWTAFNQLKEVLKVPCKLGIYGDLAVGTSHGGAEVWSNGEAYLKSLTIGAPPDACNPSGQNWGLTTLNPKRLKAGFYDEFIKLLRTNMSLFGAIRIDHFMSLFRIYTIPENLHSSEGGYISFPLDELMGILAMESYLNKCLVIGEDLGTVPPEIHQAMEAYEVFSYKVMCFEKKENGHFKSPEEYPANSLVIFSTHDLPTLQGFWTGEGLKVREKLNLFPNKEIQNNMLREWAEDKQKLKELFQLSDDSKPLELFQKVHQFIAKSKSRMMVFQLEDYLGQTEQVNLPGTIDTQYPNWRIKLSKSIEELFEDDNLKSFLSEINSIRASQ